MDPALDPIVNDLSRPFLEALWDGELPLPFCLTTERHFWPPCPTSPFVTAGATEWRSAGASGVLTGLVIYRRSFHPAFADAVPYGVGLVELNAGPRLRVHLADVTSDDRLSAGDRVRVSRAIIVDGQRPALIATRACSDACKSMTATTPGLRAHTGRSDSRSALAHPKGRPY
jgi:uncharacterized OB-fold protein